MKELECVNCKCKFSEHTCKLSKFYHGDYYILLCDTCLQNIPEKGDNPYLNGLLQQKIREQQKELDDLRIKLEYEETLNRIGTSGSNYIFETLKKRDAEIDNLMVVINDKTKSIKELSEEVKKQRETIVALMEKEKELRHVIENNHNACLYWRERALSLIDKDRDRIDKPEPEITRFTSFGITIIPSLAIEKDVIRCNGIGFKLSNLEER